MTRKQTVRTFISKRVAVLMLGLLMFALVPTAAAGPPVPVDPGTLTPPPNPNFTWDCQSNGQGIQCVGVERASAVNESLGPDFACGGRLILITFTQTLTAHRFHDAAGRVKRAHIVGTFDETWRLEGTSGPVLTSRGRWNQTVDYAVPGDVTSRVISYAGSGLWVTAPGVGLVFHDSGVTRFNWDESEVLAQHGPHDASNGIPLDAVCAAFGL